MEEINTSDLSNLGEEKATNNTVPPIAKKTTVAKDPVVIKPTIKKVTATTMPIETAAHIQNMDSITNDQIIQTDMLDLQARKKLGKKNLKKLKKINLKIKEKKKKLKKINLEIKARKKAAEKKKK